MQNEAAISAAIGQIPTEYFTMYPGGWLSQISVALVDAVYSIGARYSTKNGLGVGKSVADLRSQWLEDGSNRTNSLAQLLELDESDIRVVMGNGKVAPGKAVEQFKSQAVMQAAKQINQLGVDSAEDLQKVVSRNERGHFDVKRAYTSVHGLGGVTFDYFLMLLGIPGVKADRMLVRFIQAATGNQSLQSSAVKQILTDFYGSWEGNQQYSLIEFEHAIWRYQREEEALT